MRRLKEQVEDLFEPLLGRKSWGARIGYGSFVTIEFGERRLFHHRYHGEWHLWLYLCDWELFSGNRQLAHSESKKHIMQVAIDNLNNAELRKVSFEPQSMVTKLAFGHDLRLLCQPYPDAASDEDCWILFMPGEQVVSLQKAGLVRESRNRALEKLPVRQ